MTKPIYKSNKKDFSLYNGDCFEIIPQINKQFNLIFADPPYFLSNGGITVQSGKQVSVNKGAWDVSNGFEDDYSFNYKWISLCKEKLLDNGSIWISGTYHNIFQIEQILTQLNFKILNIITWVKTNPPPNLGCKCFTHSTEFIIWARKSKKKTHYFNYQLMKEYNGGKQMKDVWFFPTAGKWEKSQGKHPTQKTMPLLSRIILSSTQENDLILDPFSGSSTTGIVANLFNRKFIGIEKEENFINLSILRRKEIDDKTIKENYKKKIYSYIKK